jgi:hypothetical protein
MGQSIANSLDLGMKVYEGTIAEQVFKKNVLFQNVLKNVASKRGTTNKYLKVHSTRNVGSAAGGESITLPTAGQQGYVEATIPMKLNFHQINITDFALQAGKNSKEFLVDLLQSEYDGAKNDMQRQLSRQGYGDGSGVICQINGIGSQPTFDLDGSMVGKNPTDYFEAGGVGTGTPIMIDSSKTAATSEVYTRVTAITDGDTFTTATGAGVADNDYVFLAHYNGTATSTVSNRASEIMGLRGLIDDSTYVDAFENITRSTSIWWKSYVSSAASNRSLTEDIMFSVFLESKKKGEPKYILTSFDLYAAYGRLLSADRRYTSEMTLNGGFTGVGFNGIALLADYDCPVNDMFFIDPSTLSVEELAPMSFLQDDGAILSRSATSPAYQATLRYYANLANSAPNKSAVARNLVA